MTKKYERMSKDDVPGWWLDKVLPLLDGPSTKAADVARDASAHAGRTSPWTPSAISRFKDGIGRTVALTNGISAALQVPQPFFTAPTERAAAEILQIVKREQAHAEEERKKRQVVDGVARGAIHTAMVDSERKRTVMSVDDGAQSGRGERTGRASRRRT